MQKTQLSTDNMLTDMARNSLLNLSTHLRMQFIYLSEEDLME